MWNLSVRPSYDLYGVKGYSVYHTNTFDRDFQLRHFKHLKSALNFIARKQKTPYNITDCK